MQKLEDAAAAIFIVAIAVLTLVENLGIWNLLHTSDVYGKVMQTIVLFSFVTITVLLIGRLIDKTTTEQLVSGMEPVFKSIRRYTVAGVVVSSAIFALVGALTIWEIIADREVLYHSIGSLIFIIFGALVVIFTCLERENLLFMRREPGKIVSFGTIILSCLLIYTMYEGLHMLAVGY